MCCVHFHSVHIPYVHYENRLIPVGHIVVIRSWRSISWTSEILIGRCLQRCLPMMCLLGSRYCYCCNFSVKLYEICSHMMLLLYIDDVVIIVNESEKLMKHGPLYTNTKDKPHTNTWWNFTRQLLILSCILGNTPNIRHVSRRMV